MISEILSDYELFARPPVSYSVPYSVTGDLRYGLRMLAKTPAVTSVAILSLALGIGANTAIFSLIDAVILKALPVQDPQRLVLLTDPAANGVSNGMSSGVRGLLSVREYEGLRDRTQAFSGVLAVQSEMDRSDTTIAGGPQEETSTRLVSANYFTVLGAGTIAGRFFTSADDHGAGTAPYAVASYAFWQRRFGGSNAIFRQPLRIGNATLNVIGVAEPAFRGENIGYVPDLWIPLAMQPQIMPGRMWLKDDPTHPSMKVMWLQVIGRLKPGATLAQAKANAAVVFKQIVAEEFSALSQADLARGALDQRVELHPGATGVSSLRAQFAEPLYVLMALAGMVLLIACANVANLLLARASSRQKEIGVRIALGAVRGRLIRQFLTESVLLSVLGGILGVLFAYWGVGILVPMAQSGSTPLTLDVSPNARMLFFTAGVSILTGIGFGLIPAWRSSRVNVSGTLKEAGRNLTGSGAKIGFGKMLVIAQIAVSIVLLIGAGWFVQTLANLETVNLGYARDKLLIMHVQPISAGYKEARLAAFYSDLARRLEQTPGVRALTFSQNGIFSGSESDTPIIVEGYKPAKEQDKDSRFDLIGPDYFSSLGIPMLQGRQISARDNDTAPRVCVVNETFAKFYFPNANPIGRHVTTDFPGIHLTLEIVGVAQDVRDHSLRGEINRRFYAAALQRIPGLDFPPSQNYEIRTAGDPHTMMDAARQAVRGIDPAIPVSAHALTDTLEDQLTQERLIARLSAGFAALALLLACIGLYGVLSYGIAQRTNEIGIRMALGAAPGGVIGMILRETTILIAIGLIAGIPATLACARFVQTRLFGLKAADPVTLAFAITTMIAVAVFSAWIPARRASRIDPLEALRYE